MTENVQVFKLSTGEEIIARVIRWVPDNETVVLDRARTVITVPAPDGQSLMIRMIPTLASNQDGEIELNDNHIVFKVSPNKELEKGYLESTTGLQLLTE